MPMEWQMMSVRVGYEDDIVTTLKNQWEPFAVGFDEEEEQAIFFKRLVNIERDPKATDMAGGEDDHHSRRA